MCSPNDLSRNAEDEEKRNMPEILERKRKTEEHERALRESLMSVDGARRDIPDRIMRSVRHAARQGRSEVLPLQFPAEFCPDGGRAISNFADGCPGTLQGRAKIGSALDDEQRKPLGYKVRTELASHPNGMPGDVALHPCS